MMTPSPNKILNTNSIDASNGLVTLDTASTLLSSNDYILSSSSSSSSLPREESKILPLGNNEGNEENQNLKSYNLKELSLLKDNEKDNTEVNMETEIITNYVEEISISSIFSINTPNKNSDNSNNNNSDNTNNSNNNNNNSSNDDINNANNIRENKNDNVNSSNYKYVCSVNNDIIVKNNEINNSTVGNYGNINYDNDIKNNCNDISNCSNNDDVINNTNNNSNNTNNGINNNLNSTTTPINITKQQNYPHSSSTFSLNKNEEFHFIKPPDCPVFKPTEEEFKNPLSYIGKIRPFAEKFGIAKIQPPKSWTPPFTVDVDKLKFTPRVQRLNELEAKTRVKLNFLDQIAKFWELQGSSLKIPMVERKALDLYSLHRIVQEEGGIEQTTKERKWSKVAHRMNYPSGKSIGAILKGHYERILHPFDIFTSGKTVDIKLETELDDQDYKPHGIVSRQQITPPNETTARRSKRFANATQATCGLGSNSNSYPLKENVSLSVCGDNLSIKSDADNQVLNNNSKQSEGTSIDNNTTSPIKEETKDEFNSIGYGEYKRMHYGFGGKMTTSGCGRNNRKSMHSSLASNFLMKRRQKKNDPLAKYICHFCNRGDAEENMLLCDGCDDSYHTFCLMPPLNDVPKGDWRCPKCVVEEVNKPQEAFGFEQAQREYTLQQFGEMADQFKADYFNMAVHLVPTELVEREFWRIVSSIDEDVTVEYGADLHTMDHGSGFPTKSSLYLLPGDQEYAESSWNLNNLPILEESILGHINADISGMKVPWMYVGMCFATFCWHNEDHWSYSINYLHWGEPKTWYGVPGTKAEQFEETMKSAAPELFHSQPDLLHQLVTIMNPNILMKNNVPVYRTDQHAGEFVITFPRAYHAGFNQGYNFAEAVNFAPADWMKMGRECVNHYSMLRRFCVFSHDELVCKMALNPDKLNLGIATACYLDMAEMVDTEKKLRKSLLEWGVTKAEREAFELIPDDERQCDSCKTTCFLSAVTCQCTKSIVCLRHYIDLCSCTAEKHTLQYRYTLDELPLMLKKLKVKAETFETWLSKVRDVLDPNTPTTITLEELQNLAQEAEEKKFPSSVILERLNSAVLEAEKCVTVIQQLDINKMRTRKRNSAESAKYKLTMDELDLFVQEIDNLCCIIQEGQSVRDLQLMGKDFIEASEHLLKKKLNKLNETELEQLLEEGVLLCIDLPEMERLKCRLEQYKWFKKVREFHDSKEKLSIVDIHTFLKDGLNIVPDVLIEKELLHLQQLVLTIECWEEIAKNCFENATRHELIEVEVLLEKANDIGGELPSEPALRDAVKRAKEWLHNVEILQSNENYPYFHTLENVVQRGKNIPLHLEELKRMEEHLEAAKNWKDKTAKTFLKKQTQFHLMDVLSPRYKAIMLGSRFKKKSPEDQFTEDMTPQQMVNQFKLIEEKEMSDMRELRKLNLQKNPLEDKYCLCKRKFYGNMFNCQLCKDWFHEQCVPPLKNVVRPRPQNSINSNSTASGSGSNNIISYNIPQLNLREKDSELKYLCPSCMRSRRPRLETILQLLVSLQRLPIRLPEGEALQCLTERAMNWQDRARQIFSSEPVKVALQTLSLLSQKYEENCKLINNPLNNKNGENNSTNKQQSRSNKRKYNIGNKRCNNNNNSDIKIKRRYKTKNMTVNKNLPTSEDEINESSSGDEFRQQKLNESLISSIVSQSKSDNLSQTNIIDPSRTLATTDNDDDGNSYPFLSKVDMPLITLDKITREKLEDLMMEGDLLEVSLDETSHLWKILNTAKPSISDLALIHLKYNLSISNNILVNSASDNKKRRSADDPSNIASKKSTTNVKTITLNATLQHNVTTNPHNILQRNDDSIKKLKHVRKIKKSSKNIVLAIGDNNTKDNNIENIYYDNNTNDIIINNGNNSSNNNNIDDDDDDEENNNNDNDNINNLDSTININNEKKLFEKNGDINITNNHTNNNNTKDEETDNNVDINKNNNSKDNKEDKEDNNKKDAKDCQDDNDLEVDKDSIYKKDVKSNKSKDTDDTMNVQNIDNNIEDSQSNMENDIKNHTNSRNNENNLNVKIVNDKNNLNDNDKILNKNINIRNNNENDIVVIKNSLLDSVNNECTVLNTDSNTMDMALIKNTSQLTMSPTPTTTLVQSNSQNVVALSHGGNLNNSITSTISENIGKKRKRGNAGSISNKKSAAVLQAQIELKSVPTTAASTSDDDEECSASSCCRPSGREVDWVQCDGGCNKWFHMFCVGLDKNEIKPDDDYICKRCKKATQKTSNYYTNSNNNNLNNNNNKNNINNNAHNINNKSDICNSNANNISDSKNDNNSSITTNLKITTAVVCSVANTANLSNSVTTAIFNNLNDGNSIKNTNNCTQHTPNQGIIDIDDKQKFTEKTIKIDDDVDYHNINEKPISKEFNNNNNNKNKNNNKNTDIENSNKDNINSSSNFSSIIQIVTESDKNNQQITINNPLLTNSLSSSLTSISNNNTNNNNNNNSSNNSKNSNNSSATATTLSNNITSCSSSRILFNN